MAVPNKTFSSPKEALAHDGVVPVKIGRGRMSVEAKARLAVLISDGWRIAGYEVSKPDQTVGVKVVKSSTSTPAPAPSLVVKRTAAAPGEVIDPAPYRYEEDEMKAVADDGEVFGMREACQTCGYSLVGHTCNSPVIHGKPVKIVKR